MNFKIFFYQCYKKCLKPIVYMHLQQIIISRVSILIDDQAHEYIYGGVRGVMPAVEENRQCVSNSNPG